MQMDERIKRLIEDNLHPTHMELINESHKHAGHAGDDGSGQTHFKLKVSSKAYEGLSKIERHRKTMTILDEAFKQGLHALSLDLSTPK